MVHKVLYKVMAGAFAIAAGLGVLVGALALAVAGYEKSAVALVLFALVIIPMVKESIEERGKTIEHKKWAQARRRQLSEHPMLVHEEAISAYVRYIRIKNGDADDWRSTSWTREAVGRYIGGPRYAFEADWISYYEFIKNSDQNVSKMRRIFHQKISSDTNLNEYQVRELIDKVSSSLDGYLAKEAERCAKEEERRKAAEAERVQREKAAQERSDREQRLLSIRLGHLYSSPWNANEGCLPVEQALKAGVPERQCFVYRVDVGGESYVGYTTATPTVAMEEHVTESRLGNMETLHKVLRRFGYVCETGVLAECRNEVDGLLARLVQINKLRPALNLPFEGAGEQFNLIEQTNEFGEKVLYVENKKVCRARAALRRRSDPAYLRAVMARIEQRYTRLESNYKTAHDSSGESASLSVRQEEGRADSGGDISSDDVVAFARKRMESGCGSPKGASGLKLSWRSRLSSCPPTNRWRDPCRPKGCERPAVPR